MDTPDNKSGWRSAPRRFYSPEFKLKLVLLALEPGASVADIARRHQVNDNILFNWIRLYRSEGRVTRRQPVTVPSQAQPVLIPVEMTQNVALAPPPDIPVSVVSCRCEVIFARGHLTLTAPSTELLAALVRELIAGDGV
ncbi:transposase [Acerihabitans sp. TG2]|uniref:IS66-like element accessory protein TnpA n=1 Tax=Acerihabitans sp. TG2 TaxID=3096008 RepID=UPI002B22E2A7|nr:transposase [Acerihabitans sp. TG2]MEA9393632.1 transposase [Acerihabitans sp. TG2]